MKIELKQDDDTHQQVNDLLKNKESYVIITCSAPSEDGDMQVKMTHSGDETLISYLLEMGQEVFAEKFAQKKDFC